MLKALRTTFALIATTAAIAAPAYPQESAKPQESPWAMRAPAAVPQGAPTRSAQQRAAEEAAEKGTPEQRAFAHKVADIMHRKDYAAAMKQLFAPSTLKCIGKNEDFLQDRIKRHFELPISRQFKLKITKLPANIVGPSKYATYPILPTHLMGMDFTDGGNHDTVNLPIGQEDGKWYEAQPCPTEAGMERFAKLQHMREVRLEHAKQAVTQVKDPLKSQLLALIGKHENVSAWQLCMNSLHYDFQTCRGVVSILAGDPDYE
jgi:hypothetical protein